LVAELVVHVKSVAGVLALEEVLDVGGRKAGGLSGRKVLDAGRDENDIDGGVIADGALASPGEVVEKLARGDGEDVWPIGVEGRDGDGGDDADDGDDDEEFEQGEGEEQRRPKPERFS